jgi:hypothetical protein
MQSLLNLLRGRMQHPVDAAEWTALLNIAEQETVLPWAAERLRLDADGQCTLEQRQRLDEIHREAQVSTFVWTETLKSTLAAFHHADLPVISFKGPCLAERLYGDAALRTCYDLDFLVRQSDLASAEHLLTDSGFVPHGDVDDYHQRWRRKAIILELHHNVENPNAFEIDMDAVWARTIVSEFQGLPIRLLGPSDELLYLCLHAVRHRFERLCLMLDLVFAFRRLPFPAAGARGWDGAIFENAAALGWMMAAHLDPQIPVPRSLRVQPRDQERLEKLADRLWNERMLEQAQMLDWRAQHRFYLDVENPGRNRFQRRWRHMRILQTRLIDADFSFAAQFNLHRNWQVRLLRPVRLLIKALRPPSSLP